MIKTLLLASAALAISSVAHAGAIGGEKDMCKRDPSIEWCQPATQPDPDRPVTFDEVAKIDKKVRTNFRYRPDPEDTDTWEDRSAQVNAGKRWEGDCDELVVTTIREMIAAGIPRERIYRLAVKIDANDGSISGRRQARADEKLRANHIVAAVRTDDRNIVVVGDTTSKSGPHSVMQYDGAIVIYSRTDRGLAYSPYNSNEAFK